MKRERADGRIITFYSYKGGTGRSMALANIAWILAGSGKRVLAIDWDLEAPGLHRYFRPFLIDEELSASDGLIDLVDRYANQAIRPMEEGTRADASWYLEYADFSDHVVSINFDHFPLGGKIDLLPAGRQGERYAVMVSSFNWQNFYDRLGGGGFLEAVKDKARAEYDYVLIDSRTGVSDTAGICSVQMPDTLIVCFTYNNQSIKGAASVARSATERRRKLVADSAQRARTEASCGAELFNTPLPYRVFPVPMRVDASESDRLALRQAYARDAFAGFLTHLQPTEASDYWGQVEVPHTPFYSYEEVLSPLKDNAQDPKTVLAAFLRLTRYLTDHEIADYRLPIAPQEKQRLLDRFAETPLTAQASKALAESQKETEEQALARLADAALARLTPDEQLLARRVLERLVKLGRDEEGAGYFPIRAHIGDFNERERPLIQRLAAERLLKVGMEPRSTSQRSGGEQSVALADDRLLRVWKTLLEWLDADREFLIWRQQLRTYLVDWERSGRDEDALLSGRLLHEAQYWLLRRPEELNAAERDYLAMSSDRAAQAHAPLPNVSPDAVAASAGSPPHAPAASSRDARVNARSRTMPYAPVLIALVLMLIVGVFLYATLGRREPPLPAEIKEEVQKQIEQQVQQQVQQQLQQQAPLAPQPQLSPQGGSEQAQSPTAKGRGVRTELHALIEEANSTDKRVRVAATERLYARYARDPEAIDIVAEQLNPSRALDLNVDSRANYLNFLLASDPKIWREHTKVKTGAYLRELMSDTSKYSIRSATAEQIRKLQNKLNAH